MPAGAELSAGTGVTLGQSTVENSDDRPAKTLAHGDDGKVAEGKVYWSPDGAALLGLPARQCEQPFRDFLAFVHPEDRDQLFKRMQDAADHCSDYEIEYRVVWQDGSVHWLAAKAHADCNAQGVAERTLGIVWDITPRKLQELETAEQKELAEVTLASIGDGVVTTDANGNTRFLNRVAEQLTGWSQKLASGLPIEQTMKLVYESPQPGDSQLPQALRADPVSVHEHVATRCLRLRQSIGVTDGTMLVTRDGRSIAIEDSASPIWSSQGDMLGTVVVFRDGLHDYILAQFAEFGADPTRICFEITETAAIANLPKAQIASDV
eukprot:gene29349-36387_t